MSVLIYTDGSYDAAISRAGVGAMIFVDGVERQRISRAVKSENHNEVELLAVCYALSFIKDGYDVTLYTDSQFVVTPCESGVIDDWHRADWKTKSGKHRKHFRLWKRLRRHRNRLNLSVRHVSGHSGVLLNERADRLARAATYGVDPTKQPHYPGAPLTSGEVYSLWRRASETGFDPLAVRILLGEYHLVSMKEVTSALVRDIRARLSSPTVAELYNARADEWRARSALRKPQPLFA